MQQYKGQERDMLDEYGDSKDLTDIRSEGRNSVEFLYAGVAFR